MAGASELISVKVDDRELRRALERLAGLGGGLEGAFAEIGEYLTESTKQRFDDQVDPDGLPWEPLDPKTVAHKKRNADKVLIEYGQLMDQLHYNADAHGVEFGSALVYAATQQFGAEDRGIPARPFLGINADDEAEILRIVEGHIQAAIEAV